MFSRHPGPQELTVWLTHPTSFPSVFPFQNTPLWSGQRALLAVKWSLLIPATNPSTLTVQLFHRVPALSLPGQEGPTPFHFPRGAIPDGCSCHCAMDSEILHANKSAIKQFMQALLTDHLPSDNKGPLRGLRIKWKN